MSATTQIWPDARGRFGPYGGRYVPETLVAPLEELQQAYASARADSAFAAQLAAELRHFAGRPTPLYEARRLAEHCGGARIFLKREDLAHTEIHPGTLACLKRLAEGAPDQLSRLHPSPQQYQQLRRLLTSAVCHVMERRPRMLGYLKF